MEAGQEVKQGSGCRAGNLAQTQSPPPQQAATEQPEMMMRRLAPVIGVPVTGVPVAGLPPPMAVDMAPMLEQYRELSNRVGHVEAMQVRDTVG